MNIRSSTLILCSFIMACTKIGNPTPVDKNLIEEYTYDPSGVVFKIVNDVEHAWNYQENLMQKIDSIYLMKFQYIGSGGGDSLFTKNFTWFTKKGQYVYWRYKYTHDGYKNLGIGFPNQYRRHDISHSFCIYLSTISCNTLGSTYPQFIILFPMVNDTVLMRLSTIRPDMFKDYK